MKYERELTATERQQIKKLVCSMCANYDKESKECLPLDWPCYMIEKVYTGAYCKYFKEVLLPLHPVLEGELLSLEQELKHCAVCGEGFVPNRNQAYCSDLCSSVARKKYNRKRQARHKIQQGKE